MKVLFRRLVVFLWAITTLASCSMIVDNALGEKQPRFTASIEDSNKITVDTEIVLTVTMEHLGPPDEVSYSVALVDGGQNEWQLFRDDVAKRHFTLRRHLEARAFEVVPGAVKLHIQVNGPIEVEPIEIPFDLCFWTSPETVHCPCRPQDGCKICKVLQLEGCDCSTPCADGQKDCIRFKSVSPVIVEQREGHAHRPQVKVEVSTTSTNTSQWTYFWLVGDTIVEGETLSEPTALLEIPEAISKHFMVALVAVQGGEIPPPDTLDSKAGCWVLIQWGPGVLLSEDSALPEDSVETKNPQS